MALTRRSGFSISIAVTSEGTKTYYKDAGVNIAGGGQSFIKKYDVIAVVIFKEHLFVQNPRAKFKTQFKFLS